MLQYFDLFTKKLPHFQKHKNQYKILIYQTNLTCTEKAALLILTLLISGNFHQNKRHYNICTKYCISSLNFFENIKFMKVMKFSSFRGPKISVSF